MVDVTCGRIINVIADSALIFLHDCLRCQGLFFPVNTQNRAGIDGVAFDLCLRCSVWIVAFCPAVIGKPEYARNVLNTEATTDALILIDPWLFGHIVYSFFYLLVAMPPITVVLLSRKGCCLSAVINKSSWFGNILDAAVIKYTHKNEFSLPHLGLFAASTHQKLVGAGQERIVSHFMINSYSEQLTFELPLPLDFP